MKRPKEQTRHIFKLFLVCFFWPSGLLLAQQSPFTSAKLAYEISADGSAIFFQTYGESRKTIWLVQCGKPLGDCTARAPGMVLRIDNKDRLLIRAAVGPKARISTQHRNFTIASPELFSRPLSDVEISIISRPHSFIVVEEDGLLSIRQPTVGLDRIASYLRWLNSSTAKLSGDARRWPDLERANNDPVSSDILRRSQISPNQEQQYPRQLVPADKPQSEFAIRSQGGSSFFSKTGRAGY